MRAFSRSSSHGFGSFARLLADKGTQHEAECLEHYRAEGRSIYEVPPREPGERFDDWVARVGTPWDDGFDVIYQMPFVHDGMRGIADFLVKVDEPVRGRVRLRAARCQARPHRGKARARPPALLLRRRPSRRDRCRRRSTCTSGSDRGESSRSLTKEFHPYWNRLRSQLRRAAGRRRAHAGDPAEPCAHCEFCEFAAVCDAQWRDEDSLVYVAGIRASDRARSRGLGHLHPGADWRTCCRRGGLDLRPERLERLVTQAELQVEARNEPDDPPPFRLIEAGDDPTWGHGLELLPEPDDGDVFLDFEGDPFWTAETWPLLPVRAHRTRRRRHLDVRRPDGPTTAPGRSGRRGSSSSTCRTAGPRTRTCTSTTTTTRSDRPWSAWPPITASARRP